MLMITQYNESKPPKARKFDWLHVPKTGTSFLTALIDVACPDQLRALVVKELVCPVEIMNTIAIGRLLPWMLPKCAADRIEAANLVLRKHCSLSELFIHYSNIGLPLTLQDGKQLMIRGQDRLKA